MGGLRVGKLPSGGFCQKRLEVAENRGVDFFGDGKEAATDW
jgi:hypothetical protein